MKEEKKNRLIEKINKKRTKYIQSKNYQQDLVDAFMQSINFKSNEIAGNVRTAKISNIQSELLVFYSQLVSVHKEVFGNRAEDINKSLMNSLYSFYSPELFNEHLNQLNDKQDSFMIIPSIITTGKGLDPSLHSLSVIIRKQKGKLIVETIDKASHSINHIKNKASALINNTQIRTNYIYEIPDNKQNRKTLIKSICPNDNHLLSFYLLGRLFRKNNYNLKMLEKISDKHYQGQHVAQAQFIGNCYVKEVIAGLKHVTLPTKQMENTDFIQSKSDILTPKIINKTLKELIKIQLNKVGADKKLINYINDQFNLYSGIKEKPYKNKWQMARTFDNYFKRSKVIGTPNKKNREIKATFGMSNENSQAGSKNLYHLDENECAMVKHYVNHSYPVVSHTEAKKSFELISTEVNKSKKLSKHAEIKEKGTYTPIYERN